MAGERLNLGVTGEFAVRVGVRAWPGFKSEKSGNAFVYPLAVLAVGQRGPGRLLTAMNGEIAAPVRIILVLLERLKSVLPELSLPRDSLKFCVRGYRLCGRR